jgi:hypothetical protein
VILEDALHHNDRILQLGHLCASNANGVCLLLWLMSLGLTSGFFANFRFKHLYDVAYFALNDKMADLQLNGLG